MYLCENAEWFKFTTKAPVLNTTFSVDAGIPLFPFNPVKEIK